MPRNFEGTACQKRKDCTAVPSSAGHERGLLGQEQAMAEAAVLEAAPFYPDERSCRRLTFLQLLRLFALRLPRERRPLPTAKCAVRYAECGAKPCLSAPFCRD
jgi:hypothetical protein